VKARSNIRLLTCVPMSGFGAGSEGMK